MGKKKEITAEAAARKEMIRGLLANSMEDVMELFKETMAEFINAGLQGEMTEHLGYGRYDYSRKQTQTAETAAQAKSCAQV